MIKLEQVSKSFKSVPALQGLTLHVGSGEILGLLGANGAGKSTTINLLLGFLKPDAGTASVDGMDCSTKSDQVRKVVGYIPENVNLYPYLSGVENLDYFCRLAGLKYAKDKLQGFLETCGLKIDAHNIRVSNYSKGMRQKIGIAIAYAKKAKVYLLDEPASGLDPLASNELSELLKKLAADGATILMASHDIFRVREVCNRIGILKQGQLVKELATEDITANELESLSLAYMQN
ncbi:MAG: ABC transporter ATP-binding protein [Gemmataceae bacterium]